MPGFARWTSLSIRELARILRATLKGESVMPSPRLTGTRESKDVAGAEQKQKQKPRLSRTALIAFAQSADVMPL